MYNVSRETEELVLSIKPIMRFDDASFVSVKSLHSAELDMLFVKDRTCRVCCLIVSFHCLIIIFFARALSLQFLDVADNFVFRSAQSLKIDSFLETIILNSL